MNSNDLEAITDCNKVNDIIVAKGNTSPHAPTKMSERRTPFHHGTETQNTIIKKKKEET